MSKGLAVSEPAPITDLTLTTILLTLDDAEASAGAIKVATQLASDTGAELVVLSVLPAPEGYGLMGLDARAVEEERASSMVERIAADAKTAGVNARAHAVRGDSPAEVIVEAGRELKADVIVLGRRGRNDLARAMLGDLTARVIGAASSPVLVVPRAASLPRKRLLLASDGSPASERAGRTAALCAKLISLPVTVMSVEVPDHEAHRQAEAQKIVARTVNFLRVRGVDADGKVARGTPPEEIVKMAGEVGADLIVVGSEGRSGLGRVMLGGNCQAVIGKSTCPVLVTTAHMPEYRAPQPPAAPIQNVQPVAPPPPRRTFLVVADETAEMQVAIDYACRRAHATGGTVTLLRVVNTAAQDAKPTTEKETAERERLRRTAAQIEKVLGEPPVTHLRYGDPSQQVLDVIANEPSISALVLAASADPRGPGPLITELVTRHAGALLIPLMIVPGHASGRLT